MLCRSLYTISAALKEGSIPPKNVLLVLLRIARQKIRYPFLSRVPNYSLLAIAVAVVGLGYPVLGTLYGIQVVLGMFVGYKLVVAVSDIETLERIDRAISVNES